MVDTVRSLSYFQSILHPNIPNATPDATVLEAQAARDLLISLPTLAGGGLYIVDGTTYAATRAGIQAAVTAASANPAGGRVCIATNVTLDNTSITVPSTGNVEIFGLPGVVIKAPATGAVIMFFPAGSASAASTISTTINRGALSVNHNQTGGLTFARGDYILINDPVQVYRYHLTRVASVSGAAPQTVQLAERSPFQFTTGDVSTVQKLTMIPNLYVHDLTFDANGNTAAARAVVGQYLASAKWERLYFSGFKGSGLTSLDSAGAYGLAFSYNCISRDMEIYDSGTLGLAALGHAFNSRCLDENIFIHSCGFAYVDTSNYTTKRHLIVSDCGEGIGVGQNASYASMSDSVYEDCSANRITGGGTGFRIRGGSQYCKFIGCSAYSCDSDGVFVNGQATTPENNLVFDDCHFEGNALSSGLDIDIANASTQPYALEFANTYFGTVGDLGVGTLWDRCYFKSGGAAVGPSSAAETTIYTKTIAANQLKLTRGIRLEWFGYLFNNSGAARTVEFKLKFGGNTYIDKTTGAGIITASANFRPVRIVAFLQNVGATNVQNMTLQVFIGQPTPGGTGDGSLATNDLIESTVFSNAGAVDTTANAVFALTAQLSASDPNLYINIGQYSLELVG